MGEKNEEGERITDVVIAFDLSIFNTFFESDIIIIPGILLHLNSNGDSKKDMFYVCLLNYISVDVRVSYVAKKGVCLLV